MELTYKDRLQMCLQLRILEKVDPDNKRDYELYREILEQGYEGMYQGWINLFAIDTETVSADKSSFVGDVLTMYTSLLNSFEALTDKEGLTIESIRMPGFDGNNETDYMSYALFLVYKMNRFAFLKEHHAKDFNSHTELVGKYKAMLIKYEKHSLEHRNKMTAQEIKELIATR